jgi:hypothetical protein
VHWTNVQMQGATRAPRFGANPRVSVLRAVCLVPSAMVNSTRHCTQSLQLGFGFQHATPLACEPVEGFLDTSAS